MSPTPKNPHLKKLLAIKYPMPKMHILYTLFALVFGYVFGMIIYLVTDWDIFTMLSISSLLSAGVFTILYKLNNYVYEVEVKTIKSFGHNPSEQYFQAQLRFLEKLKELKALDLPDSTHESTVQFFGTVFRGQHREALAMYEIYKDQPYRYITLISETDREIIFRYYLVNG